MPHYRPTGVEGKHRWLLVILDFEEAESFPDLVVELDIERDPSDTEQVDDQHIDWQDRLRRRSN